MSDPSSSVLPAVSASTSSSPALQIAVPSPFAPQQVSTKQMLIGTGAFVVLAVLFFFIRGAFVSFLVGSLKRSPNNAGLAGWGLFGALLFGSAIACIALVSTSYLTLPLTIALGVLSALCLLLAIFVAARK